VGLRRRIENSGRDGIMTNLPDLTKYFSDVKIKKNEMGAHKAVGTGKV
jgi:hypothetical protein